MSSSDYTTLRKLKQIQGSCKVDDYGDPVSLSWFDVPYGDRVDCAPGLGTGPTGKTGQTGYTGPAGPTGAPGPTNGGVFTIFAESIVGYSQPAPGFTF
jgi:hypothetical protein